MEKGSGRHSLLRDRGRSVFKQTSDSVSGAITGTPLRSGTERVWVFPALRCCLEQEARKRPPRERGDLSSLSAILGLVILVT